MLPSRKRAPTSFAMMQTVAQYSVSGAMTRPVMSVRITAKSGRALWVRQRGAVIEQPGFRRPVHDGADLGQRRPQLGRERGDIQRRRRDQQLVLLSARDGVERLDVRHAGDSLEVNVELPAACGGEMRGVAAQSIREIDAGVHAA